MAHLRLQAGYVAIRLTMLTPLYEFEQALALPMKTHVNLYRRTVKQPWLGPTLRG